MTMQEVDQLRALADAAVEHRRVAQRAVLNALADLGGEGLDIAPDDGLLARAAGAHADARRALSWAELASQTAEARVLVALEAWWAQGCAELVTTGRWVMRARGYSYGGDAGPGEHVEMCWVTKSGGVSRSRAEAAVYTSEAEAWEHAQGAGLVGRDEDTKLPWCWTEVTP